MLAVSPREAQNAARYPCRPAYAAYRIGPENSLLRQSLPIHTQGGLLCLSDQEAPAVPDSEALADALTQECARRDYPGAVLDFESPPRQDLLDLARALGQRFHRQRRTLLLPEPYAVPGGTVLLNSAVSGGDLGQYLREGKQRWRQAALDLQRLRMDFPLPCPDGEGAYLTAAQLCRLRAGRTVFYSKELGVRYFTYRQGSASRFVLLDDGDTLRRKLALGAQLGITRGLLTMPECGDVLAEVLASV